MEKERKEMKEKKYENYRIAKMATISVENMRTGMWRSRWSVCVQTNHRCHAQTGMMASVHQ